MGTEFVTRLAVPIISGPMKTYTTDRTEEGPFRAEAHLERLIEFFRANGYDLLESDTEPADDDSRAPRDTAVFVRGESEASWWSSDMTKLSSRVEVHIDDANDMVTIQYRVDVTGQHLTEADRQFWNREMQAAFDYLRNPSRTPRDLRHEESKRAERVRQRMLSYGIWGGILMFLVVVMINLLTSV